MAADRPRVAPAAAAFGTAARAYERARPGYPPAVLAELTERLGLRPGRTVLDVGAGTGKLTRELVATGAEVIAAEPVAGMAAELARQLPQVRLLDAPAEALPLPDASVDAATAAQAFHWFDADRALPELHRVLRPGATFAVVHNRRAVDTPAQAVLDRLPVPARATTPSWGDHRWEAALVDPPGFAVTRSTPVRWHQPLDLDTAVDRVASTSFVAALPDDDRAALLAGARRDLAATAVDGTVTLTYDTEVTWLRRA